MRESTFTAPSPDGVDVRGYAWLPERAAPPRGTLQILHGMAEHAGRYRRFAEAATARGLAVYAHDHRGHGATAGAGGPLGFFAASSGWSAVLGDAVRVGHRVRRAHPEAKHVLVAHSMGSFMGQELLFERGADYAAAVFTGSTSGVANPLAPVGRVVARAERLRLGPRSPSPLLTKLSFGDFNRRFEPARTPFDWLSRDPAEVDAYVADPKCGFPVTTQLWIDLLDALPRLAAARNLERVPKNLPIYLGSGSEDPVHGKEKGLRRLVDDWAAAGVRNVHVQLWEGARHEILNETNREEVTAHLLDWVERHALR